MKFIELLCYNKHMNKNQRTLRIQQAIVETKRFIAKELARDPSLRPVKTQKILDDYIKHLAKLENMLVSV